MEKDEIERILVIFTDNQQNYIMLLTAQTGQKIRINLDVISWCSRVLSRAPIPACSEGDLVC